MLDAFKDSIYYLWFSDLSDGLIQKVIDWIECRPEAVKIKRRCPKIYDKYIILSVAKWLTDNPITEVAGEPVVPTLDTNSVSNVKRDTVRDVTREYYESKVQPCKDCKDSPYGTLKFDLDKLIAWCDLATMPISTGSNYGCRTTVSDGCTKDEYR